MDLYKFHASGLIHMKFQYLYIQKEILGAGFRSRQPETAHTLVMLSGTIKVVSTCHKRINSYKHTVIRHPPPLAI